MLAEKFSLQFEYNKRFNANLVKGSVDGVSSILVQPLTFMNLSGDSISKIMNYYKILPEDVLVVYDDIDLDFGTVRFGKSGGHGGHNGLRSLIENLGNSNFQRMRLGIGRPKEQRMDVSNWVLHPFEDDELQDLETTIFNQVVEKLDNFLR